MKNPVILPEKNVTKREITIVHTYDEYRNITGIAISTEMSGKMLDIDSLSTPCFLNPFCIARMQLGHAVCRECFAAKTTKAYQDLAANLAWNYHVLTTRLLFVIPDVDGMNEKRGHDKFRFEAFGDLANELQFLNYYNIARFNPRTKFALWTKNNFIVKRAMDRYGLKKLANLTLVYSSLNIDEPADEKTGLFDHRFTVYGKSTPDKNINCGARDCNKCGRCYTRRTAYDVAEKLK